MIHVINAPIYSTSWSPNGKHVVTGSWDHSVRILDIETKECVEDVGYIHQGILDALEWLLSFFLIPPEPVLSVAWSLDGGNIVSGSDDGSIKVYNFDQKKLIHSFDDLYVGK